MSAWSEADVTAALGLETVAGAEHVRYSEISTDTRTLVRDALFVALRGENHDAHAFLATAAEAGARAAVVDHVPAEAPEGLRFFVVPDTLAALGTLARFQRRRTGVRVCAVAGSNGKTTTKELLRAVLRERFRVHATPGNLNNLVGLPLTLLGAPPGTEIVIAELGTNVPGEIARLASIAEPDAAVITTISAEHLEGLGDLDGVLREETAVLPWLAQSAPAVVADEPASLGERARALHEKTYVVGFSERADAEYRGGDLTVDDDGRVRFRWAERDVALRLRGRHNGRNAALALAMARLWGVRVDAALNALAVLDAPRMRSEIHHIGGLTVISDCYNANPGSVAAAIDLLVSMPKKGGRIAIVGTMLELGPESARIHADVARAIAAADIDVIVATGEFTHAFAPLAGMLGDRLIAESDPVVAFERLAGRLAGNETVLLKASRGVRMERLLPRLEEGWGMLHPHGEAFGSRASDEFTGASGQASAEHAPPPSPPSGRVRDGAARGGQEG